MTTIQSLERAFSILKVIDEASNAIRPAEIAECIGLPRTTVIRMVTTLEALGAVVRADDGSSFQIGPTLRAFARSKPKLGYLKKIAQPHLKQLAAETGETVYLCILERHQVHYLDQIDSRHHILLRNWVGSYFPAHTTAAGKALLAFLPEDKFLAYLKRPLEKFTKNTIIDPDQIRGYAKTIRATGYAWTYGQTEDGLVGVAAPIYSEAEQPIAAVAVGGPAFRFPPAGQDEAMAQCVVRTARQISERL